MDHFAVIGLGRFGLATSAELIRLGNTVVGIDSDAKLINSVSDQLSSAVIADATNESALKELDITSFNVVLVAIGESLESSILCVLLLQSLGVEEIWVKAMSKPHHTILSKIGVSRIIHPEEEMGVKVAQSLNYPMVNQYIPIGKGLYIVEVEIQEHCSGKNLSKLLANSEKEIEALMVRRGSELIRDVTDVFQVEEHDSLILTGPMTGLKKIAPEFSKE